MAAMAFNRNVPIAYGGRWVVYVRRARNPWEWCGVFGHRDYYGCQIALSVLNYTLGFELVWKRSMPGTAKHYLDWRWLKA